MTECASANVIDDIQEAIAWSQGAEVPVRVSHMQAP
jgi:hypothetical protein